MRTESIDTVQLLHLEKTILQPDADALRAYLEKLFYNNSGNVVVDLLHTDHICSSALGHLVYMKTRFKQIGGDIKLVINDEDLLELMDITLLNQVFQIYDSIDNACQSYK